MFLLVCRAYIQLLLLDIYVARGDFSALHRYVRSTRLRAGADCRVTAEVICRAVDIACVWYWKQIRCLQRSAAATCLLRRYGTAAELVIGAQQLPFRAHAWVEVAGQVVNDRSYIPELYVVLDRC